MEVSKPIATAFIFYEYKKMGGENTIFTNL
jgi:hypothetical protein